MRRCRVWSVCAALVCGALFAGACEDRSAKPATERAAGSPAPAAIDWSAVRPADVMRATEAIGRLCRRLEAHHKGSGPVVLRFTGSEAVDDGGIVYPIRAEEWKGIGELAAKGRGSTAGRALPAAALNYSDGLGRAKRHAYFIKSESDSTLTFTDAKPLDDESNG